MGLFQKFCEWGTDAKYVEPGKKCDLCGKKLGALETGFWSINAKWLADGVICQHCHDKLQLLAEFRGTWMPRGLNKELPYKALTRKNIVTMELEGARTVMEAPEKLGKEELAAFGDQYTSIFRMRDACFIVPTALQVGVVRAKRLKNKLVLFGFVQMGQFKKGDSVVIVDGEERRNATVLEAYVYDCPENDLDVMLKANIGKQRLSQWQKGWLALDDEQKVGNNTMVIGSGE